MASSAIAGSAMAGYGRLGSRRGVCSLGLAAICFGLALSACAPGSTESSGPPGGSPIPLGSTLLPQPAYIPGPFALIPQPLPDPASVMARPYPGYPVYGLYAYLESYEKYRQDVLDVGWRFFRIGGPITDEDMLLLMEDDVEASFHVAGGKPVTEFPTEGAFLSAAEQQTVSTLARYGPGGSFFSLYPHFSSKHIKYVHIWNEPNFQYLIPGSTTSPAIQKQKAALYGKLLRRLSRVIRNRWPSVTILGFDTGRASSSGTDFIADVYAFYPDLHGEYDILATHPGVDPVPPETDFVEGSGNYSMARHAESIRNILGPFGGPKPIWFTEAGWEISYFNGGLFQNNPEESVSPLLQAAYVCRYYAIALRLGVDRVTPFFIVDADGMNGGFFDDVSLQWRPSAYAVKEMIAAMPRPKLIEVVKDGEDGAFVYRFLADASSPSGDSVIMAWNVGGPKTIAIDLKATNVQVTDMLGATETANGTGTYQVDVGPCPVYIEEMQ